MRFKAKVLSDQVSLLYSIVNAIAKLQDNNKFAILYLDREFVRISCKSESGITCFMELSKDIFLEHRIESAAENVIVCQVDLNSLKLALQSVHGQYNSRNYSNSSQNNRQNQSVLQSVMAGQQMVILKLAKRNQMPCLCLDGQDDSIEIHQAIPVRVLRQSEMQYHLPPQINTPAVQLELPLDRPLKAIVDKLRQMGPHLYLEATMRGDLTVRLDHDGASLACFYSNLVPRWDEEEEQAPNPDSHCVLKVDANKFSTCLQWQQQSQLQVSSCLLGMVHNEMLVLHILLNPDHVGFFTYYIPVYFMHEDELE
ncbi:unnamed protein product [Cylindrotheca closterium]|uniref:Checkpoint protein n=1 Tax=Cylindrotheca closterium TaxID=2856 RepID=A0AAD2CS53_9STRA|nr:unnamed protein product [Cylindrotheca closterium]